MAITENLEGTRAGSIDAAGARTLTRHFTVTGTDVLQTAIAEVDTLLKPYQANYNVGTDPFSGAAVYATYYGTKSWSRPEGTDETWNFIVTYTTAPIEQVEMFTSQRRVIQEQPPKPCTEKIRLLHMTTTRLLLLILKASLLTKEERQHQSLQLIDVSASQKKLSIFQCSVHCRTW